MRERKLLRQQIDRWHQQHREEELELLCRGVTFQLVVGEATQDLPLRQLRHFHRCRLRIRWQQLQEQRQAVKAFHQLLEQPVQVEGHITTRCPRQETLLDHLLDRQLGKGPRQLTNQPTWGLLAQAPATPLPQLEELATRPPRPHYHSKGVRHRRAAQQWGPALGQWEQHLKVSRQPGGKFKLIRKVSWAIRAGRPRGCRELQWAM